MSVYIALLATGALVFVSAAVQHLNTVSSKGLGFVFTDRATPLGRDGFVGRAARTVQNNLESAAMALPALVALSLAGVTDVITSTAAMLYVLARIGFTFSYWLGIHRLRSLFWGIGMAMIAVLTVSATMRLLD